MLSADCYVAAVLTASSSQGSQRRSAAKANARLSLALFVAVSQLLCTCICCERHLARDLWHTAAIWSCAEELCKRVLGVRYLNIKNAL